MVSRWALVWSVQNIFVVIACPVVSTGSLSLAVANSELFRAILHEQKRYFTILSVFYRDEPPLVDVYLSIGTFMASMTQGDITKLLQDISFSKIRSCLLTSKTRLQVQRCRPPCATSWNLLCSAFPVDFVQPHSNTRGWHYSVTSEGDLKLGWPTWSCVIVIWSVVLS